MTRFDELRSFLKGSEKEKLDRFLKDEEDSIAKTVRDEVAIDRQHIELVNYCAYAFTESGPARESGFVYVRVEPLYLKGDTPRFDLVIHNEEQSTAVLIECKSSISNPKEALAQIVEAKEFAEKHRAELEREIGRQVSQIECDLCATLAGAKDCIEELKRSETPIMGWTVDKFKDLLLMLKATDDETSEIRIGRLHRNETLRRMLFRGVRSSGRYVHLLPSSHMCRLLTQIVISLEGDLFQRDESNERRFMLPDLEKQISNNLVNLEHDEIARIAGVALSAGTERGVFSVAEKGNSEDPRTWVLTVPFDTHGPAQVEKTVLSYYTQHKQILLAKQGAVERWEEFVKTRPDSLFGDSK